MNSTVSVLCKKCGNKSPAETFQLDYNEAMMVCFSCFNKRGQKPEIKQQVKKEVTQKPAGGDSEDELLSRLVKEKNRSNPGHGKIERVPGEMYVKYTCSGCSYKFKYFPLHKKPRTCPYCNIENPKIQVTGMI